MSSENLCYSDKETHKQIRKVYGTTNEVTENKAGKEAGSVCGDNRGGVLRRL